MTAMERVAQIALVVSLVLGAIGMEACAAVSSAPAVPAPVATPSAPQIESGSGAVHSGSTESLPELPTDPAGQSRVITDYLKNHRLPLVGAQVLGSGTSRQVILYGYTATPYGKQNAEARVRQVVRDPDVVIENRVVVQPELLAANNDSGSAGTSSGSNDSDANKVLSQIANQQNYPAVDQTQQYVSQQQTSWMSWLVPLLMIGMMFIP